MIYKFVGFCLCFSILVCPSREFNVDVAYPIIISNEADVGSYFGASVRIFKGNANNTWVIIGAPRANSSVHGNIKEPGVVWRCSLGRSTDLCDVIEMDPTGNLDRERGVKDMKDTGWLGATLSEETSDRFVTCASRWVNQKYRNDYLINGICYWRKTEDVLRISVPPLPTNYRLLPLSGYEYENRQIFYDWNIGQAGFSMHVTPENTLILGAPGINVWKGSVIIYSDRNSQSAPPPGDTSNIFAEKIVVRPELGNMFENQSYFGYSVHAGYFFGKNKIHYVGGAPRADSMSGQVVLFDFPPTGEDKLVPVQVINGTQIGSYFGSVLCVVDINGDGYEDLIVGAPRQTTSRASILPANSVKLASFVDQRSFVRGDEGTAFVYMSTGVSLELREILQGENKQWSHFATAISSAGDLNKDGYNDIIIGAPYFKEDISDTGSGAIYIYHGTSKGVQNKFAQVIHASSIANSLNGFGYSLSNGVDFDGNGYNDIAVGSYNSNEAVIFRSKPVIYLSGFVNTTLKRLPVNAKEFNILSCVTYTTFDLPSEIVVNVTVTADPDVRLQRVLLKKFSRDAATKNVTYKEVLIRGKEKCTELIGEVVRSLDMDAGQPIKIKQEAALFTQNRKKRSPVGKTQFKIRRNAAGSVRTDISGPNLADFCCPILNQQQNFTTLNLPMDFRCGDDDKCEAVLQLEAYFEGVGPGQNFTMGSSPVAKLVIKITNTGETALQPQVFVTISRRNLKYLPQNCESKPSEMSTTCKCSLGRYLWKGESREQLLEFDMRDLVAGLQQNNFIFHIEAQTASDLLEPVKMELVLPVEAKADSHIFANRQKIKFNEKTLTSYQLLSHTYEVRLKGPSSVSALLLTFRLPVNLTKLQGNTEAVMQVYVPRAEQDGEDVYCEALNGRFHQKASSDPDRESNLSPGSSREPDAAWMEASTSIAKGRGDLRRKRDVSESPVRKRIMKRKLLVVDETLHFECASRFVDCLEVQCVFKEFKANSRGSVTFNMRVTSDTIRELFKKEHVKAVMVKSSGKVTMQNVDEDIQGENELNDRDEASTLIFLEAPKRISTWIIVGSVVVGILLLFLIALCFYACGCFQRKNKEVDSPGQDEVDGAVGRDRSDSEAEDEDELPDHIPEKPRSSVTDGLEPIEEEQEELIVV